MNAVMDRSLAADGGLERRFSRYVVPELEALLRMALSLTRQRSDAEDLVQDTLLRAYRSLDRFDGEHPRAWLFTIMRRAHIDAYRRRRPVLLEAPDTITAVAGAGSRDDDPGERAVDDDLDAVVGGAFAALPTRYQDVLRLVDIGGLSYAEAAAVLGVSKATITSRLHRARTRLRGPLAAAGLAPRSPRGGTRRAR
jgi:RNA polymerase sigma-70 factor (ECF subfamily)